VTSRQAIQTAIIIGGIWLIFSALAAELSNLVWMMEKLGPAVDRSDEVFSDIVAIQASVLILLLIVGIAPGIYAIYASEKWAIRLGRPGDAVSIIDASTVRSAAGIILGLSIGSSGAVSLATGVGAIAFKALLEPAGVSLEALLSRSIINAIVSVIVGILLFRWGMLATLHAA
jgi:hypothetical protein